jgi:hypothetical protein
MRLARVGSIWCACLELVVDVVVPTFAMRPGGGGRCATTAPDTPDSLSSRAISGYRP